MARKPERASYSAGFAFGGLSMATTAAITLISSVVSARLYGIEAIGEFALASAPVALVWFLSTVREQPALIRRLATLPPRDGRVTALFLAVLLFSTALTVLATVLVAVGTYFLLHGPIDHPDLFAPALVGLAGYAFLTNLSWNLDAVLVSFRAGRELFAVRLNQALSYLALVVILSFVDDSVWGLVVAMAASWLPPTLHRLWLVRRWMPARVTRPELREGMRALPEMIRFGLKVTPGGIAQGISDELGTWVLGAIGPIAAVGAYNRAWSLSRRFSELNTRLSEILLPTLVERRSRADTTGFDRALVDSLRYAVTLLLLPAAVGGGAAVGVMSVFGPGFDEASKALVLLLLVPVGTSAVSVLLQAQLALDRPGVSALCFLVRLVVTGPACVILAKSSGVTGAAAGMVIGVAAQVTIQLIVIRMALSSPLRALWPLRQVVVTVIAYGAGFGAARGIDVTVEGYGGLVAALVAGTLAYAAVMVLAGGLLTRDRQRLATSLRAVATRLPVARRILAPRVAS
jgi:O-antigen/teichoic acid export membrane protein